MFLKNLVLEIPSLSNFIMQKDLQKNGPFLEFARNI